MKISVIIPTLNEEKYVGQLLACLNKQTRKADEIIVVDGRSSDKTLKIVKKYKGVQVISSDRLVAYQRNVGGRKAKGDVLVFLDADVLVKNDFLEKIEKNAKDVFISCPLYLTRSHHIFVQAFLIWLNIIFVILQKIIPSGGGNCIIVKKTVFKKIGGFNENFRYDDIDFIRRAGKKFPFKILFVPVFISDRRFQKEGTIVLIGKYLLLSVFFTFGFFKAGNLVNYKFGHYEK